jgi:hypothetical protein
MVEKKDRTPYTREHIEFILDNFRTNPQLCVKQTGHSMSSIKMMLGNAISRLSGNDTYLGAELYAEVVQDYLERNTAFGKPMSIEKFKLLFL